MGIIKAHTGATYNWKEKYLSPYIGASGKFSLENIIKTISKIKGQ
jgi:hypothetical protein